MEMTEENAALKPDAPKKTHDPPSPLNQRVVKLLSQTSVHGLSKAASTTNPKLRVFWTILFIIGFALFTANLIAIILQFASAPILTQTNYEYKEFTWPTVTLCNPTNPIAFWLIPSAKTKWKALIDKAKRLPKLMYNGTLPVQMHGQYLAMSSLDPADFYNIDASSVIHEMRVVITRDNVATSSADFDKFVTIKNVSNMFVKRLGSSRFPMLCFSLKMDELVKTQHIANLVDVKTIKLTVLMDNSSYHAFNFGLEQRKMKIYFNNPNGTLQSASIHSVYPGSEAGFTVKEYFLSRKKNCTNSDFEVEVFDPYLSKTQRYLGGYEDCRQFLSQKLFLTKCRCYNPFLPIYKVSAEKPRLCLNMSLFTDAEITTNVQCMNRVNVKFQSDQSFKTNLTQKCGVYLIPKCKETTYSYRPNTVIWNSKGNEDRLFHLKEKITRFPNYNKKDEMEFLLDNVASVVMTRESKMIKGAIETYAYPLEQFLSGVGGLLGLYLGLSIITVFEIVEFVIKLLIFKRRH